MKKHKDLIFSCTILFFTSILLFSSCASKINVINSNKTKHISGLPTGKNYVNYSFNIDAKVDFTFKSLKLDNNIVTETLFVKNLKTGLSTTKINPEIKKGTYQFGFRIYNTANFDAVETITFNYLINGKTFQLNQKIVKNSKTITNR